MKRCVIICGAKIESYERIRNILSPEDFYIFCDSGLYHEEKLGVSPHLIIGDFDSHPKPLTKTETIVLPCEKDDTDSVFAVKEALRRGFDDFLLVGAAGSRLDHTLANTSLLLYLHSLGKNAVLIDDFSEMEIVSSKTVLVPDTYSFFSLLNISGTAKGITVKNAKYPLENGEISCEYQYGVSNQVLKGKSAEISVSQGRLLLIKIF